MKTLKDVNNHPPFTNSITVNFEVICADPKVHNDMYFMKTSIFAKSEEDYYNQCKELNITPSKRYKVIGVNGVGDLYDVVIEQDDNGNRLEVMSAYFRDIPMIQKKTNKETNYTDKNDNIIMVGETYFISPMWSKDDLYCKVIDAENYIKNRFVLLGKISYKKLILKE